MWEKYSERDHISWRIRNQIATANEGYNKAAIASLWQANDLLPTGNFNASWN